MPAGEAGPAPDLDQVWDWLARVPDPEIPVVSVVDLGIVREVRWDDGLVVAVTPTYSGCPATSAIEMDIVAAMHARGLTVRIERRVSPPWTTDWMTDAAREKLRAYGIAPPIPGTAADGRLAGRAARLAGGNQTVPCPRCASARTERVSQFGSTPCKAAWRCLECLEPFDYFKCL